MHFQIPILFKIRFLLMLGLYAFSFASLAQKSEAEDGVLSGTEKANSHTGFSGTGYVTGFDQDNDAVTMSVDVADEGLYELWVGYSSPSGDKTNDIYINGEYAGGQVFAKFSGFKESSFGKIRMDAGQNKIKVVKNWGYFELDYTRIEVSQPNDINNIASKLVNEKATDEVQLLYRYLSDIYGHRILSGQQSSNGGDSEINFLQTKTGKKPAIKGFDLIEYSPSRVAHGSTSNETNLAVDWWKDNHGIVSLMWHWNAPKDLIDQPDYEWWRGFYTYATTFDLSIAMNNAQSEEYQLIIRDIDAIATQLKVLSDAKVPVLWRPLHEAEGAWFWWGAKGAEPCVWLWKLMYDRITNHHGINNLIWVWTGTDSESALDWYPGDDYVDIVGADIYLNDKNYSTSFSMFDKIVGIHEGKKIITLSETGVVPDAQALDDESARWNWFVTWSGDFIMDGAANEVSHLNTVYNHEYVITLDELPDFTNYVSPVFTEEEEKVLLSAGLDGNKFSAYPNPANDFITIRWDKSLKVESAKIYDLRGQMLNKFGFDGYSEEFTFDLSFLQKGFYLLHVAAGNEIKVVKVLKN